MTREEAIDIVKCIAWHDLRPSEEDIEQAIKALEQEPRDNATLKDIFCMGCEYKEQQPCTDAISRQAVLEAIRKCHCEEWEKADIGASIEALLPVTPAEKVGWWIPDRCDMYTCSKCNHTYTDLIGERYGMNFCPNCGAKMQEVEE